MTICTLCMSRKHRASHCPMKPQGDSRYLSAMDSSYRHWSDCSVNNGPAYAPGPCDCGGIDPSHRVRPDDTVDMGAGERNTRIENDLMLRTPRRPQLNVIVWGRR